MQLGILKETLAGEKRVAATPETVKAYISQGFTVNIEASAGDACGYSDSDYEAAGAAIKPDAKSVLDTATVILSVNLPEDLDYFGNQHTLIGLLDPHKNQSALANLPSKALAMEMVPRISRAQSMDALSSQANLAGYRAVLEAVSISNKVLPMMMTAAGRIQPAQILIMGVGVAGLQAIATAKRLGAVVFGYDVRPVVKEQVESLGAKFIEVPNVEAASAETASAEDKRGYAKEMSDDYKAREAEVLAKALETMDIVITTAQIPGKPAPRLITSAMLRRMKQGAVIVDMAAGSGGNVEGSVADKVMELYGITICGKTQFTSLVAKDASNLYARNLLSLIKLLVQKNEADELAISFEDDIAKAMLIG